MRPPSIFRGASSLPIFTFTKAFSLESLDPQNDGSAEWGLSNSEMGDAIGRVYVARYLSSQTKAQIDDMVTQIRLALSERLGRIAG